MEETQEANELVKYLIVNRAYDAEGNSLSLRRIGRDFDGGYVVPELAIRAADALIGYGISYDISFEESVAAMYGKPTYGFDGITLHTHENLHELCKFIPLCIVKKGSSKYGSKGACFDEHLTLLNLLGQKIFIKMDIEGDEYDVMPDILIHSKNITAITLELHFSEEDQISKALQLIKSLQKDFILVHLHGHNGINRFISRYARGYVPRLLELSYIHKSLVQKYEISPNQSHPTPLDMVCNTDYPEENFEILPCM